MNEQFNGDSRLLNDRNFTPINILLYIYIFLLIGIFTFFYFLAFVPIEGDSMENTISNGHYCLVQRKCFDVSRGDIVTINTSTDEKEHIIIKRVIGIEGDKFLFMASEDGQYVDLYMCRPGEHNFSLIDEPYIKEKMKKSVWESRQYRLLPYTPYLTDANLADESFDKKYPIIAQSVNSVPEDSIFFLGDNRNISRDSRYYGTRTLKFVQSKLIYYF